MIDPLAAGLLVGVGGAVGAMGRHAVGLSIDGRESIVVVNVVGSFVLGMLMIAPVGSVALLALAVGVCGAFTTFSSFTVETATTAEAGEPRIAVAFALANLVGSVAALLVGSAIAAGLW